MKAELTRFDSVYRLPYLKGYFRMSETLKNDHFIYAIMGGLQEGASHLVS